MSRPWLARLAFSFFIAGLVLAWEAYQASIGREGTVSRGRIVLYMVAAMLCFVMGFMGVRERHRP